MRIKEKTELGFSDVLIEPADNLTPLRSRADVDLNFPHKFKWGGKYNGFPIIVANMDGVGTMSMAKAFHEASHGATVALRKHYDLEDLKRFFNTPAAKAAWYTIGINADDTEKFELFVKARGRRGIAKVCMDIPHGGLQAFSDRIKQVRDMLPKAVIMAGNVATPELARILLRSGADIAKIGIGPGAGCETRNVTGIGRPQFSAVADCAEAAMHEKGAVCADGGCKTTGDIAKAFGAGAGFVMIGTMFAGHDEGEVDMQTDPVTGEKYVEFWGMSSEKAMKLHSGGMADYKASEGNVTRRPHKGPVEKTMQDIMGALRSTCTYVGAASLPELHQKAVFIPVHSLK